MSWNPGCLSLLQGWVRVTVTVRVRVLQSKFPPKWSCPHLASMPLLRVALFQSSVGIGHTALKEEDEGLFLLLVSDVPVFHMTWN